ncbi:replicative DNA helicase, partial [Hungatella hathewayi]
MDDALIKRVLPHSVEAEQSVIGSMLMDREAIIAASEIITADDFYQHQYGVMFEAMVELFNENRPVDLITLQNRLKEKDVPPEVSSLDFVRDIITTVPTSANVKSYANIVREKAVLRRLIKVNEDIANTCYAGKEPLETILATTEKTVFDLLQSRNSGDFVPIRQVAMNVLEKIEEASKNQGTVTGIPTGFIDLDYKTSGLQPSDFILIAARPSMGKTAFVLNLVDHIAVKKGLPCMVFSLEMSKEQLVNRMLAMESNVDSQKLRTGTLSDSDWDAVVEGIGVIGNSKLIIDDTPGISIMELRSRCRKMKLEYGLSVVIIDYLQLMSGSGKGGGDNRQQEISEISRSLKALARELSAPVIALSQLSRACETRQDHRPMLSDLRESGAIEQDADVVMFLYRDDYYNKD